MTHRLYSFKSSFNTFMEDLISSENVPEAYDNSKMPGSLYICLLCLTGVILIACIAIHIFGPQTDSIFLNRIDQALFGTFKENWSHVFSVLDMTVQLMGSIS